MSWWDLKGIIEEARDIERHMPELLKLACPRDGQPLEQGPHGELHCPFCGYIHSRDQADNR
jgi:uncharacterized Zn finger protein (UPF0148 family)